MTHPHPNRRFVPQAVLTKSGKINTASASINSVGASVNTVGASVNTIGARINTVVRPINTVGSKPTVNHPRSISNTYKKGYLQVTRPFNTNKNSIFNKTVNTVMVKDTTARYRAVVSKNKGKGANAVKASACWGNPQQKEYKEKRVIDSGCSRHMIGNKCYLTEYEDYDGGFVSFGDGKGNQTNGIAGTKDNIIAGQVEKKIEHEQEYILIPICTTDPLISQDPKVSEEDAKEKPTEMDESGASDKDGNDDKSHKNIPVSTAGPSCTDDDLSSPVNAAKASKEPKKVIQALEDPSWVEAMQEEAFMPFKLQKVGHWLICLMARGPLEQNRLQEQHKKDGIIISQDKYVADILKKFNFATVKIASTPIETNKALVKDEEAEAVDVHLYKINDGLIDRIFRYLKGQPKLGLWYPRDSPFDLEPFLDSDYARASLDRKSTIGGCQFIGKRLILWQCKKQTIVANSTTEAEDCYEKKLIQVIKIHIDHNVADLLTKAFDVSSPTIYASYIEQFWNTATSKTVNSVKQIHAIVDGKAVVISESSVRSDLLFNDEDVQVTVPGTKKPWGGGAPAQTRSERVLKEPNEPSLPKGHTSGSGEGSMEHTFELMDNVLNTPMIHLSWEITYLEVMRSDFDDLDDLVDEGITLFKRKDAANQEHLILLMRMLATPSTPPPTTTIFCDEDSLLLRHYVKMKVRKQRKRKRSCSQDKKNLLDKTDQLTTLQTLSTLIQKTRIDVDHELTVRLTHKEQEKYTIEERARLLAEFFKRRKKQLAAKRAEAIRNKLPTRTQVRNMMITYLKHMVEFFKGWKPLSPLQLAVEEVIWE
ncbi:hypothetical protein Tco_1294937 [Tanacetum coccineum]